MRRLSSPLHPQTKSRDPQNAFLGEGRGQQSLWSFYSSKKQIMREINRHDFEMKEDEIVVCGGKWGGDGGKEASGIFIKAGTLGSIRNEDNRRDFWELTLDLCYWAKKETLGRGRGVNGSRSSARHTPMTGPEPRKNLQWQCWNHRNKSSNIQTIQRSPGCVGFYRGATHANLACEVFPKPKHEILALFFKGSLASLHFPKQWRSENPAETKNAQNETKWSLKTGKTSRHRNIWAIMWGNTWGKNASSGFKIWIVAPPPQKSDPIQKK